jgi:magnesium-transporting ATPase (P-type)
VSHKVLDQGHLEAVQKADEVENDMTFLGLVGLRDPPREQAIDAIKLLKKAGVEVYMITGDHPRTAVAIASHLGIIANEELKHGEESQYVIEGQKIDSMDRGALAKLEPFPKG